MLNLICTIVSMVLFIYFNIICLIKYGLLSCFSAYGAKWSEWEKQHSATKGLNIWSLVTILSAILLIPPMLTSSIGNPLQFLCFFAPLYLFLVGLTPNYSDSKKGNIIHQIGAWGCVTMILIWLFVIVHKWIVILPIFTILLVVAVGTRTLKESITYYLEMAMYISVYLVLLLMFI